VAVIIPACTRPQAFAAMMHWRTCVLCHSSAYPAVHKKRGVLIIHSFILYAVIEQEVWCAGWGACWASRRDMWHVALKHAGRFCSNRKCALHSRCAPGALAGVHAGRAARQLCAEHHASRCGCVPSARARLYAQNA
jgi:hypothetical protein